MEVGPDFLLALVDSLSVVYYRLFDGVSSQWDKNQAFSNRVRICLLQAGGMSIISAFQPKLSCCSLSCVFHLFSLIVAHYA